MTNDEWNDEARKPKPGARNLFVCASHTGRCHSRVNRATTRRSAFGLRHSFVIRHSIRRFNSTVAVKEPAMPAGNFHFLLAMDKDDKSYPG
jgi:hypothetical protein